MNWYLIAKQRYPKGWITQEQLYKILQLGWITQIQYEEILGL